MQNLNFTNISNWASKNTPTIIVSISSCYFTLKISKLIYKIYIYNKSLSHIPVNPAFPVIFGGIQKFGKIDNAEKILRLGDAANAMEENKNSQVPLGLTKAYLIPFVPFLILSEHQVINKILENNVHVRYS